MQLLVGLGNPGSQYARSRHNLGFMVVDTFAYDLGLAFREETRFRAQLAKGSCMGESVYLMKPTTYMNESGSAVRKIMDYYKIDLQRVLIVVDDAALPYGELRLREKGGTGGHNGLKSVEQHLGTQDYARLRMGIGEGIHPEMTGHVLGDFTKEECELLPTFVKRGVEVLRRLCSQPFAEVMNQINRRDKERESHTKGQESKHDRSREEKASKEAVVRRDVHPECTTKRRGSQESS